MIPKQEGSTGGKFHIHSGFCPKCLCQFLAWENSESWKWQSYWAEETEFGLELSKELELKGQKSLEGVNQFNCV